MTAKRIKKSTPTIRTRDEMERLVGEICDLTARANERSALMDQELIEVRSRHESYLAELSEESKLKVAAAEEWARANEAEFGTRKSLELLHGTIGFRTGMPQLKPISGFTWDRVLEKIDAAKAYEFIRIVRSVDKAGLLNDRERLGDDELRKFGVRVHQDEPFFVEPKITEQSAYRLQTQEK